MAVLVLSVYKIQCFAITNNLLSQWCEYVLLDYLLSGVNLNKPFLNCCLCRPILILCQNSLPHLTLNGNKVYGYCHGPCLLLIVCFSDWILTTKSIRSLDNVFFIVERVEAGAEFVKNTTFLGWIFVNHPAKNRKKHLIFILTH